MAEGNRRKRATSLESDSAKRQQLSHNTSEESSSEDESEFGQKPPSLIDYIKGTLNNYPDGSQILKEIIQNADDAGATKVEFLLDYSSHSCDKIIHPVCSRYQGQALYSWNNAKFHTADWKGIQTVGVSGKAKESLKVGRFGLGFVAVYHITDVPIVLSDRSIGILDPQEQIFHRQPGRKFKLSRFFRDAKYSDQQSCFRKYFGYEGTDEYNGTIFRFPLRTEQCNSTIKPDGVYTADKVKRTLFEALEEEAANVLIFLKRVKSIKLSTRSLLGLQSYEFSVKIPDNYLIGVQLSNSLLSKHVLDKQFRNSIKVTVNVFPISSTKGEKVWLVLNLIGFPQSPPTLSQFYSAKKLDYLPWIGIAMETGIEEGQLGASETLNFSHEWDGSELVSFIESILLEMKLRFSVPFEHELTLNSGNLFCFLPTPEPSYLPFNLHGYFALSNDRRRIKWPTRDSDDTDSKWNELLVGQLAVSAYAIFYRILIHCFHHDTPEVYHYRLLGGETTDPHCIPSTLVNQGLEKIVSDRIVYSHITNEWVRINDALFHPIQYSISEYNCTQVSCAVGDLLKFLQEPLVLLPNNAISQFNKIQALKSTMDEKRITPYLLRQILKKHSSGELIEYFVRNIATHTLVVLSLILSDLDISCDDIPNSLENIPLLITASSGIFKISNDSKSPFYMYGKGLNLMNLFPGTERSFVNPELPTDSYSCLLTISQRFTGRINIRDISNLRSDTALLSRLFKLSLESYFENTTPPLCWDPSCCPFNRDWLRLVWSFVGSDTTLASSLGSLPLLPKEDTYSVNNQLLSVIPSASAAYILYSSDASYSSIEALLAESGAVFIHSHRFIDCLDNLVVRELPSGLLTLLKNSHILNSFIRKLESCSNQELLFRNVIDILNIKSSLSSNQGRIIERLPIFPNINRHYVPLTNTCIIVPCNICLPAPVTYPPHFLSSDNPNTLNLYKKLGKHTPDINLFVRNHILVFLKTQIKTVQFEISLWLLKNLDNFSTQLIQELREIEWVADNTNNPLSSHAQYRKPSAMFDPDDAILREILATDSSFFPHSKYDPHIHIARMKRLFNTSTRLPNQCLFEEVISSAVTNFNPSPTLPWNNRFLNLLRFVYNCWKSPLIKINSKIANFLHCSLIVLPSYERPDNYPLCLPFSGEHELVTIGSVVFCTSEEVQLIASVKKCVPIFTCSNLSDKAVDFKSLLLHLKCSVSVTGGMLAEQLIKISQTKIQRCDSQRVHSILESIYGSESIQTLSLDFISEFIYVKTKNIFVNAEQVIKRLDYALEPYYYSFEKLNYSENAWKLFQQYGASEAISSRQLYDILHSLYYERELDKKSKDILLIIKIIDSLAESQDQLGVKDYYLLGEDNLLHLSTECVLNDSQTTECYEVKKAGETYFIVNSNISRKVALKFGAKSLKYTMLGNAWGFCEYVGQYEDLTTRLKSILKDYESSFDVFKELVQNADDAEANVIRVLIDYTSFPDKSLLEPSMKHWQGPALYFYNDAQFTEQDFPNIMKIFGETKIMNNLKIGKFGLGFNTVYHLTDLPSFVSGRYIHMLDPHRKFLVDEHSNPGIQVDFVNNNESIKQYHDQFIVFNSKLFKCNILEPQPYEGTLFRLPFRPKSVSSDISTKIYDNSRIEELRSRILEGAESCIRFLQHITCIEIYEKRNESNEVLLLRVSKSGAKNPFPKYGTFISNNSKHFDAIVSNSPVNPVSHNNSITISSECSGRKQSETFIVSCSTGTCECRDFIRENKSREISDYTPVCSVALPISALEPSTFNGDRHTMYCFLPLPVTSPYPMYIHGYFALDQSRRGIACTEDGSDRTKWNQALINDALVNAFIQLFIRIREYKKCPVSHYYSLWPLCEQQQSIIWKEFPQAFAKRVIETDALLFYDELLTVKWIGYSDANFIVYEHYYELDVLKEFFVFVRKQFNQLKLSLVDIAIDLQAKHLFQILFHNDTRKCFNLERICRDIIFPNLHSLTLQQIKLVLTSLLPLVHLPEQGWTMNLFSSIPCIPCGSEKHYSLLLPCKVVSPHSKFAKLYGPSDKRTILPDLEDLFDNQSDHHRAMVLLDIIDDLLPVDDLIDRCRCQEQFDDNQLRTEHCMVILEYLNLSCKPSHRYTQEELKQLKNELMAIDFLPIWKDEFSIDIGLQNPLRFANPNQCFPYSLRYIVPPNYYAVREEVSKLSQIGKFLSLNVTKNTINIELPISLMRCLQQKEQEIIDLNLADELSERAETIYNTIFAHWRASKESDILREIRLIWHPMTSSFCQVSALVCSNKYLQFKSKFLNTFPYSLTKDQELRDAFLNALGVKGDISTEDAYSILTNIAAEYNNTINHEDSLLIQLIVELTNSFFNDYEDYRFSDETKCVLLSSDLQLCEPSKLKINDMFWEKGKEHTSSNSFIYKGILPMAAFNLGASSIRSNCFKIKDFAITGFGQHEDIADRINSLKRSFPCGTTIFKELIQNAEDAGATEIAFILDKRDYSSNTESLCFSEEEQNNWHLYQQYTPSLLVYMNSFFSELDLQGIQSVGLGGKKERNTIGKFGLGFNAVYHLTDSPCLLTRRSSDSKITFCIFDPFRKHLTLEPGSLPGLRLDFSSNDFKKFEDQFRPYSLQTLNDSYACSFPELTRGDYSLFRIPIMNPNIKIEGMLEELLHHLPNFNLFLENINEISLYQRNEDNTIHILGTISVDVVNSKSFPIPVSLKCEYIDEIQISVKEINVEKNIPNKESNFRKRKKVISQHKSSWLLFTHKGSVDQLGTCCPTINEYKGILEKEKLTNEVYAGVAVEIPGDTDSNTAVSSCLYSYLPIGDDKPISFPIKINAPFILEPERQHIRFKDMTQDSSSGIEWEDVWHSAIIEHVITPLFASLILYLRDRNTILFDTISELSDYYAWYYTLFPDMEKLIQRNNSYNNFLYALCKQLYSLLYGNNEAILLDSSYKRWFCLEGINGGVFKCYSLSCAPIDLQNESGESVKSKEKRIRISNRSPDEENTFYRALDKVKLPLTCAPDHVETSFKRFSYELTRLDQLYLLSFLDTNKDNLCRNSDSVLSMGEIEVLLKYLFMAPPDAIKSYTTIPLKIDYEGKFCCFSKERCSTFRSKYAPLLPHCARKFLASDFPMSSIVELYSHGFIRELTVEFLSKYLKANVLNLEECVLFWDFILHSNFQSHNLINEFGNHSLIPIKTRPTATLTLISCLPAVLNMSADKFKGEATDAKSKILDCVVSQKELYNALIKSNCPELNLEYFNNSNLTTSTLGEYLKSLTIHSTITMQAFLEALKLTTNKLNSITYTDSEATSIRNLLCSSNISTLPLEDIQMISSLRILLSHNKVLCSLINFENCFIIKATIRVGLIMTKILTDNGILVFKSDQRQDVMINHITNQLKIRIITLDVFFLDYVISYLTRLDSKEQIDLLSAAQLSTHTRSDFIHKLKPIKFILQPKTMNRHSLSELYSPNVRLYSLFFSNYVLPAEWFENDENYHSLLSEVGLHDKVDLVSIVKAAQMIQNKEIVLESSERNVPLSSLVNLLSSGIKMSNDDISLLHTLAKIRFLPVWKFMPNSTIGITHEFVSFNEAELSDFSDCCCTATYIHDSLVSEIKSAGRYLQIRSKPQITTVVKHFEIICRNFCKIRTHKSVVLECLFTDTYRYLSDNCREKSGLHAFQKTKCIFYDDRLFYPRNMVFSLDTILRDYLFKVPDSLKVYSSFLELVGVTHSPTCQHYAAVLMDISCDKTLGEERKEISINTFHLFIASQRKAEEASCTPNDLNIKSILVLSEDFDIVPIDKVVYIDNTRLKIHVRDFPDLSHLQFLLELLPNSLGSCDPPTSLHIKHLSEIIHESLDPTLVGIASNPRYRNESRALEYLLKCREFAKGLIRIYYDSNKADGNGNLNLIRIKNDIVKDIGKEPEIARDPQFLTVFQVLQNLTLKIVNSVTLQITNDRTGCIVQKCDIYDCFIENSVLYANGGNITGVNFFNDLTYALNLHLGNIFRGMLFALELCLSCDNTCDIMQKLDSFNIQPCPFISSISLPQSPTKPSSSISPLKSIVHSSRSSATHTGFTRSMLLQIIQTPPDPISLIPSPKDSTLIPDTFTAKLWIRTAQCDLRAAQKLITENSDNFIFPSHACTNCFECAMKACIAILYLHRYKDANISCQRNLDILLELVENFFHSSDAYSSFRYNCISLLNFDENARNPFMTPGIGCCLPMEHISVSTAKEAIEHGSNLLDIVKSEFPIFTNIMFCDTDGIWNRPTAQSLIMAQLENFPISTDSNEEYLLTSCNEFSAVARNFFNTLPRATIISILKINHKACWDNFVQNVKQKVGFQAGTLTGSAVFNESTLLIKPLFHGSSRTNPEVIIRDPLGFKIEYAHDGMWGKGIYFAVNASYSHKFSYVEGNTHSMFLSKVFVGNAKFEDHDKNISQPPRGYHSITGIHRAGTRIYVIYENGLAYPGYLIKYRI